MRRENQTKVSFGIFIIEFRSRTEECVSSREKKQRERELTDFGVIAMKIWESASAQKYNLQKHESKNQMVVHVKSVWLTRHRQL
jgi:hypothetical protein